MNEDDLISVIVHKYGRVVGMKEILEFAMMYGLKIFEDGTQAAGASWQGIRVGNLSNAGFFSFDFGRDAGCADVITTNDEELYVKIKAFTEREEQRE